MMGDELAAFENDTTTLCAEHMQSHWKDKDYRACVSLESKGSKYFIKFDRPRTLWPKFSTQSYIYGYAKRHHDGHGRRRRGCPRRDAQGGRDHARAGRSLVRGVRDAARGDPARRRIARGEPRCDRAVHHGLGARARRAGKDARH